MGLLLCCAGACSAQSAFDYAACVRAARSDQAQADCSVKQQLAAAADKQSAAAQMELERKRVDEMVAGYQATASGELMRAGALFANESQIANGPRRYAFCSNNPYYGSSSKSSFYTAVFQIPLSMKPDQYGQIGIWGEPTRSYAEYLMARYGVSKSDAGNSVCNVFDTASAAQQGIGRRKTYDATTLHNQLNDVPWTLKIEGQAVAVGMAKSTEAEALYDAEDHAPVAIPLQSGKTFYVNQWDAHSCEQHDRRTSEYAGAATVSTWSCAVQFTYSEVRNPTASAALGQGATREAAIQTAQLNHAGAAWDEPFCSETRKNAAYGSASYKVGESGAGSPWYVCTIGYKSSQ